jgi:hypothetical protein
MSTNNENEFQDDATWNRMIHKIQMENLENDKIKRDAIDDSGWKKLLNLPKTNSTVNNVEITDGDEDEEDNVNKTDTEWNNRMKPMPWNTINQDINQNIYQEQVQEPEEEVPIIKYGKPLEIKMEKNLKDIDMDNIIAQTLQNIEEQNPEHIRFKCDDFGDHPARVRAGKRLYERISKRGMLGLLSEKGYVKCAQELYAIAYLKAEIVKGELYFKFRDQDVPDFNKKAVESLGNFDKLVAKLLIIRDDLVRKA